MNRGIELNFKILKESQLLKLHQASLRILESVGMEIHSEKARKLFKEAGARVKNDHVRIPIKIVERAIHSAPERITVFTRDGEPALFLGGSPIYFGTGSECPYILDPMTNKPRPFTLKDIIQGTVISDYLNKISFIMCLGIPSDINPELSDLYSIMAMLSHSYKPMVFNTHNLAGCKKVFQMCSLIAGGEESLSRKPSILLYAQPTSPLRISGPVTEKMMFMSEKNLPVVTAAGIMAGATAPFTIAGRIVQANAEMLGQLVLSQLTREGSPVIYGSMCSPLDLKTISHAHGTPEAVLAQGAIGELARYYKLPSWGGGGCSASKTTDEQAVWEAGHTVLTAAMSGINMVHDVGFLESAKTYSFEMLVMCNEIISAIERMFAGIVVDEDTMAMEAIQRVGTGGSFLDDEHTIHHMRDAWESDLIDRHLRGTWEERGMETMLDRAKKKVKEILLNHTPRLLPERTMNKLKGIIKFGGVM